jgi:phage terminase large subunit-like protein
MHLKYPRAVVKVENRHFGPAIYQTLKSEMLIGLLEPGQRDKVERAAPLLNMLERGQVYLPADNNSWKNSLLSEWLGWTGHKDETNDQIDCSAYAATVIGHGITQGWGGADATRVPLRSTRPTLTSAWGSTHGGASNRFTPW